LSRRIEHPSCSPTALTTQKRSDSSRTSIASRAASASSFVSNEHGSGSAPCRSRSANDAGGGDGDADGEADGEADGVGVGVGVGVGLGSGAVGTMQYDLERTSVSIASRASWAAFCVGKQSIRSPFGSVMQ
jgi:hypothetical protein